jgi:hypothetical protein
MSLLLLSADPATRWTRTAETWVVGPSFYPLDIVDRMILILELSDKLRGQGILTKFSLPAVGFELLNLDLLGRRLIH